MRKTMKGDRINVIVVKQGGPILNGGYVVGSGDNVVAVEIDMRSKHCEVCAESYSELGTPILFIEGSNGLHLKKGKEQVITEVSFPDFRGWQVFASEICRYTLRICLTRRGL